MTNSMTQIAAFVVDGVIKGIVDSGHPKAKRLAEDYNEGREALLTADPDMTIGEATVEVLTDLLQQAYGIHFTPTLADRLAYDLSEDLHKDDAEAVLQAADAIRSGDVSVIA